MFESEVVAALDLAASCARAESVAVAAKLAAVAVVVALRADADAHEGVSASKQGEFVAVEISAALSVSTGAADALIALGECLATRLPQTRAALARGDLDLTRVRAIVDRTACVTDLAVLADIEDRVLDIVLIPGRCVTRGQVARVTDRVIAAVDPALVVAQRVRAEADRDVTVRPDTHGMSTVWGALPATGGLALQTRLRVMAASVCGEDPRTQAQRRADALVALAHGDAYLACTCGSPVCPAATDPTVHHRCAPLIQVVVAVETLLGAADLPGVLTRYGIVDPDTVRTLAADARWQQVLTHTGTPQQLGRTTTPGAAAAPTSTHAAALRYTPSGSLAALVRLRDGHCRFPGCTTPAPGCDLDHVTPYNHTHPDQGGLTTATNLACLCRWHHRMKTEGHWQVSMDPDATQHWTGPGGQHLTSTPAGLPHPDPHPGTGTGPGDPPPPPRRAPTTAPRSTRALTCAQLRRHPDHDHPDDHHEPDRWTPDRHWAHDTWTELDLDAALDQLVAQVNAADRRRATRVAAGRSTGPSRTVADPPDLRWDTGSNDPDDKPPF